ncbi:metalloprotease [Dokdonia sinensis]|uniref:Metalloprotease n=1 Tax=Dokdonia sinensis TaxID=2479847 RepID=A0A3M0G4N2_9FLAO|nr:metalloprotease [Dokdonia sinensis]RMB59528.1 metalloprotease [Dokdonia sinensis]
MNARLNFIFLLFLVLPTVLLSQHRINITARLIPESKTIELQQQLTYVNESKDTLHSLYLTDWANSFSSKTTPLAQRFAENYDKSFHLAKMEDRGFTNVKSVQSQGDSLVYSRPADHPDILKVEFKNAIAPAESRTFFLKYDVILPDEKFTRYGVTKSEQYNLRYWFMTPASYNDGWQYYSNKNINDRFIPKTDIEISISIPKDYFLISDLETAVMNSSYNAGEKIIRLSGNNRIDAKVFLRKSSKFESIETDFLTIITDITDEQVPPQNRALIIDRIAGFLNSELGSYPHKQILVSNLDYRENPVYGLNQLPDFIRPFPDGFQYELKLLKTTINNYVDNTVLINPRYDRWAVDGIKTYLLQSYMDTFYPDLKVVGSLSKYWLVRQFYASNLEFNDQFNLLYMHMARLNLDQPLTKPRDSLIKFNLNIANQYKSGAGLFYLGDFIGQEKISSSIKKYYNSFKLESSKTSDFERILREATDKNIDWFFDDFVNTRKKIDFKFGKTRVLGDSLYVDVKNKKDNKMPVSVFAFKNDTLTSKTWVENITDKKTIVLPKDSVDRLVLNYNRALPEYNLRDNYKKPGAFLGLNKPFQFKLLQDLENPSKNQLFFMPVFEYNLYDGFTSGMKVYNKTLLRKEFNYKLEPQWGARSNTIVGKASLSYTHNLMDSRLHRIRYGFSGSRFSYADDLFFRKYTPFIRLDFRKRDLRLDEGQSITARWVNVDRDEDVSLVDQDPNYSVFDLRYTKSKRGIISVLNYNVDFQIAKNFSKVSSTAFYRRLFLNNRQLNLRFFGGVFLNNNARDNGDFFSFALDRPTDYLFDYNYYGRSEDTGLFSQQYIVAEGGFKSQLEPAFANDWILTTNASTTIWKYIYAYGDFGIVKNEGINTRFLYDSGVQLSLLDDYFELYFPVYSNLGWEIGQPNYETKIRFTVSLSFDTLIGLFTRKWY